MRILISIYSLEVGGAQTFVIRLVNELSKNHKVYLFIHNQYRIEKSLLKQVSIKVSIYYVDLPIFIEWIAWKINRLVRFFDETFLFQKYLSEQYFRFVLWKNKIDLVNSHMHGADKIVSKYAGNVPWVISMHGCYESELRIDKKFYSTAKLIFNNAIGLIYAADKNLEILKGEHFLPLRKKIYYGMEKVVLNENEANADLFVFGMVARSVPSKGWMQALDAFDKLCVKYHDKLLEFWAIFDESEYSVFLRRNFNNTRIKFLGFQKEPIQFIRNMDVCLLPSYFPGESLPNSIIEYLGSGKPVIVSDIGEIIEMISFEEQRAGFVIPLNTEGKILESNIFECMESYLNNPEMLKIHSVIATKAFSKFSIKRSADEYVNFFDEVINKYNA